MCLSIILILFCNIVYLLAKTCTSELGFDIPGNDLRAFSGKPEKECCQVCAHEKNCKAYAYAVEEARCFLKTSTGPTEPREGYKLGFLSTEEEKDMVQCTKPTEEPVDPEFRIVGGDEAVAHRWPWMVAIMIWDANTEDWKFRCGGSLVSPTTVVTAAHCFSDSVIYRYQVRLGVHDINDIRDQLHYEVTNILIHPYWKIFRPQYDIAVITLPIAVEYTSRILPVCLGKPKQLYFNVTCYVTGWGQTLGGENSIMLRELKLPLLNKTECKNRYGEKNMTWFDPDTQICAGYTAGGKDSCKGDSGGPLTCKEANSDVWRLHGLVSRGMTGKCGQKDEPAVYTRVSYFSEWIKENALVGKVQENEKYADGDE